MRALFLACALGVAATGAGCQCGAALFGAERGTLWVTSEISGDVMVLDAADGGWIGRVSLDGGRGASIATSPDHRTVYAADEATGTVSVIDVPSLQVTATFPGLTQPRDLRTSPDGRRLYVTQAASNEIAVIDLGGLTVQRVPANLAPGPSHSQALWVSPPGQLYVLNQLSSTLVSMGATAPLWSLRVASEPSALVTTRAGDVGYLTGSQNGVVQRVFLTGGSSPDAGPSAPVGGSPSWLSISSDDRWLVISNGGPENTVSVVDLNRGLSEWARVRVGIGDVAQNVQPAAGAVGPDATAFVCVGLPPQISVVDLEQRAVVAQYALPEAPGGVVYLPRLSDGR